MKPLAIDLFCGCFGWSAGWLELGGYVVGFDLEHLPHHGAVPKGADLVIQDVRTLHGSQFKDADLIVASPPCQEFSYMAMPWSRAKAIEAEYKSGVRDVKQLTALFDACFRIQREASEAAGHHIPLVVENVRGAIPWVGRSRWNFGSYHLWGDVPALMPMTRKVQKFNPDGTAHPAGSWFAIADSKNRGANSDGDKSPSCGAKFDGIGWTGFANAGWRDHHSGAKVPGFRFDGSGKSFQTASVEESGTKQGGDWFNASQPFISRMTSSKSNARKAASAQIAKIPFALAQHIARSWRPRE